MANPNAENVLVASPVATGGVLTADLGTTLPTTVDGSVASFTATGYIGEDGVTLTIDRETQDVFAWGGQKVRVIQTSYSTQLQIPFLETSPEVLELVFGDDNVTTTGTETVVTLNADTLPHFALVIDTADGDKRLRITAADAQVVEQDDLVFSHTAPTIHNVTIELFPDSNGDNATLIYDTGDGS